MRRDCVLLFSVVGAVAACASRAGSSPDRDLAATAVEGRRQAARALGESPERARRHVPALLRAMSDPDGEVRWRADFALGRVGRDGVQGLVAGLADADARVRRAAAYVLGPMGPRAAAAVPAMLQATRDPDPQVRVWSVFGVGLIDPHAPGVVDALAQAMRDRDTDVVRVAIRVAFKIGPEARLVTAFAHTLGHEDDGIRKIGCIGLRRAGPIAAPAAADLVRLLGDPDAEVRMRAAQALGHIGKTALALVQEAVKDPARKESAQSALRTIEARAGGGTEEADGGSTGSPPDARAPDRARWYQDAKVGMFIHWGLYAVLARARPGQLAEWVLDNDKLPEPEYQKLAQRFTATRFDADEWVRIAREAGIKYMVLTSKHHDGFSLWDTKLSDYNSVRGAPARRDLVGELAAAGERGGVKLAVYYSMLDWHHPDFTQSFPRYVQWMHDQLRELLTRYPIWGLWFDGEWGHQSAEWRAEEILSMARKLRPLAFVNDRLGDDTRSRHRGVDFYTKEQEIPREALQLGGRPVAWETCQTFGHSWGYNESPDALRSGERVIEEMVDVVSKGGNFLLNVGPRPDGTIPEMLQERLKVLGSWLKKNGEAIYGTERSPFGGPLPAGRVTAKGNRIYVFLDRPPAEGIVLPPQGRRIKRAWVLASGEPLAVSTHGGRSVVATPKGQLDPALTVAAIELVPR